MPADTALPDRCRSVRELAAYWRTSPARVRALARRGLLAGFQLGRALRFSPTAIVDAERLLAAPVVGERAKRRASGISREIEELLMEGASPPK